MEKDMKKRIINPAIKSRIEIIAEHYGLELQLIKGIEEMAEFSAEISKHLFNNAFNETQIKDSFVEELADVIIMISQIRYLLKDRVANIEEVINKKLNRQMDRIAAQKEKSK